MITSILHQEFMNFFHEADTDEDDHLTLQELTDCLRKHGYKGSDQDIKEYFNLADLNGNQKISLGEYMVSMKEADIVIHSTAAMRRIFDAFDTDGSGSIDKSEVKTVFEQMGRVFTDEEVEKMMDVAGADQSGTLGYEEFIQAVFGNASS